MHNGSKLTIGILLTASSLIAWPLIRNRIAQYQISRAETVEGYLWIYGMKPVKHGPVKLSAAQKEALLNTLDWDYTAFGRSYRGFPMCVSLQALDFSSPDGRFTLTVSPNCEVASFAGWTRVGGYMPGEKRHWNSLKHELFPSAPEPND